jgi:predicted transcriptional regulator
MPSYPDDVIAGSLHNSALNATRDTVHGFRVLPGLMIGMLESDLWHRMVRPIDGQVFTHDTVEQWVLGEPWAGLHFPSWDALYAILTRSDKGRRAMAMLQERGAPVHAVLADTREAGPADGGRPKGTKLVPLSKGGNDRLAARLKRDHPAIAEAAARGEYRSMRAAGIAAGIVRVPSVYDQLVKSWRKATEDERERFLADIRSH